jgi:hypothetical protein
MEKIKRLRAMACDALLDYQKAIAAGGEPVYPQWANDILDVCRQAEQNIQFSYSRNCANGRAADNLYN